MVTQNTVRTCETGLFRFKFATVVDLNKYLQQIKLPISLYTCASTFWVTIWCGYHDFRKELWGEKNFSRYDLCTKLGNFADRGMRWRFSVFASWLCLKHDWILPSKRGETRGITTNQGERERADRISHTKVSQVSALVCRKGITRRFSGIRLIDI